MAIIEQLSAAFADQVAAAAGIVVSVATGRRPASGILWHPDIVIMSEQMLPDDAKALPVCHAGQTLGATLAGRDPGTNDAVLKLDSPLSGIQPGTRPAPAGVPRVGSLALVVGAEEAGGPTARLAMVHATGEAWHSMAGGRIDSLIRLDTRLGRDEGGPVLSPEGGLIGMSTAGPRRRTLVIPTATLARVIDPLLAQGSIARGWLGVGLQPVIVPDGLRQVAGRDSGLMVVGLAGGGPAEAAGVLPGDILL
ncbi:MAG TPA: S1C family serine protease, partial [Rhodopila sp.]|nr:S1C family serine protease [Rhodopila sp.]